MRRLFRFLCGVVLRRGAVVLRRRVDMRQADANRYADSAGHADPDQHTCSERLLPVSAKLCGARRWFMQPRLHDRLRRRLWRRNALRPP